MNSTTISYLSTPIDPFSLQAATWSFETNPYLLRVDGCTLADGTQNCSQVCTNVASIFSSGSTFENCLAYPSISALLQKTNAPASEPAIEVYGIIPNDRDGSQTIINTVNSCLKGYANSVPSCRATGGSCVGNDYGVCSAFFTTSNATGTFSTSNGGDDYATLPAFECIDAICNYIFANAKVSADVGGIGVYISYILQISFVFFFWLLTEYFRLLHPFITRRLQRHDHTIMKIHPTRQKEIFLESAIEFHKAQCFFMSAILVAALIATEQGGLEAASLQQVFNNLVLLSLLAIGGSLPILFMLFKLRLAGHRSWYTFILSTITLLLAVALNFSSGRHKTISNDLVQSSSVNIPGCGTADPTMLCLQGYAKWIPGQGNTEGDTKALYNQHRLESDIAVGVSLFLWLFLLLDEVRKLDFDRLLGKSEEPETEDSEKLEKPEKPEKSELTPLPFFARLAFGVLDFVICIGTLYLLVLYLRDLIDFGYGPTEWSFGQIVAILAWIQPIIQYFYLQFHGVEGHRWSLPGTLFVVRKAEKRDSPSQYQPGRGRVKNSVDLTALSLDRASIDRRRSSQLGATSNQRRPSRMSERSESRRRGDERRGSRFSERSVSRLRDGQDKKTTPVVDISE